MKEKEISGDWISPKITILETAQKGKGMFANEFIKTGERILFWDLKYINKDTAEKCKEAGMLVMQWDDDLFTAEDRGTDLGYFINHSCDSNTWMTGISTLTAKRDINIGEEITADYSLWETDEGYISKWECKCESPLCRKRITGKDWKIHEVQERYKNHFLPLILKKIEKLRNHK